MTGETIFEIVLFLLSIYCAVNVYLYIGTGYLCFFTFKEKDKENSHALYSGYRAGVKVEYERISLATNPRKELNIYVDSLNRCFTRMSVLLLSIVYVLSTTTLVILILSNKKLVFIEKILYG